MAYNDPIYIIKATKEHSEMIVRTLLCSVLGDSSIDRLIFIDAPESNKRVFVVAFWRMPLVNQFHDVYTEPIGTLHGSELPWKMELMDAYMIFSDGYYPAPHFLRNSKNLTDAELDELGIGGPGEFIYIKIPRLENECHWEMYRDGKYYMPDLSYIDRPRLEPLGVSDAPIQPLSVVPVSDSPDTVANLDQFNKWRDFYIEYPASWPKNLTLEERERLETDRARLYVERSFWSPDCGRDPTALAEMESRLPRRMHAQPLEDEPLVGFPQRTLTSHKYRSFS